MRDGGRDRMSLKTQQAGYVTGGQTALVNRALARDWNGCRISISNENSNSLGERWLLLDLASSLFRSSRPAS